ncbi:hypothetical protein BD309DRAFT_972045 [Dichomitus squalens]|uniref:Uncharacterized protein n=1 Tax=Dichomitus squalens TaxID=114155 RepID=A0A4Q9NBT8_9APHY|nr:hypothetical protein BD309DRAFT_972045 [Dichomitus squalens]TBU51709.1 hypothetical protein BD310DRAFT_318309 [Dichomitus squalens]
MKQLIELTREDPNPSPEVAQCWAERHKPRVSVTLVLDFMKLWRAKNLWQMERVMIRVAQAAGVRSKPRRAPLPSSKPSISTAQSPFNSSATPTIPPARQTAWHIPAPSGDSGPSVPICGFEVISYAIHHNIAHPQRSTDMDIASERKDSNVAHKSTAPARAPGASFIHFISPVDASGDAVLDIRQIAADLLVEECHHCPRTFVELGA